MKRLIILLIATFVVTGIHAQNNKRTSAFNYFKAGKLDKAKEYIDPCITHEKTMGVAKTWYYRGNIYLQIALSTDPEYKNLDPNALMVAYESYKKCAELDTRDEFKADVDHNFVVIASNFFNKGVALYNEGDYLGAAQSFENTYKVSLDLGTADTLSLSNMAFAYDIAGEYDKAMEIYLQLLEMDYANALIYNSISTIYMEQMQDTVLAEEYILMGREKFPDDYDLLIAETNLALSKGENEKAIALLKKALETDSENKTIWFALGTNYETIGDKEAAAEAYQKAINIDPNYADAYYNMGAMYNNEAAEIIEEANELPLDAVKEYDAEKAKADVLLEKALPYLEKSDELNPGNYETLVTLKQIYTILNNLEQLQIINDKIKAMNE